MGQKGTLCDPRKTRAATRAAPVAIALHGTPSGAKANHHEHAPRAERIGQLGIARQAKAKQAIAKALAELTLY